MSSGTFAFFRRSGSLAQLSPKYKRYAMGRLANSLAIVSETATWQFSCFPTWPQYCRATPTECFLS